MINRIKRIASGRLHFKPENQRQQSAFVIDTGQENPVRNEATLDELRKGGLEVILETEQNHEGTESGGARSESRTTPEASTGEDQGDVGADQHLHQRDGGKSRGGSTNICCVPIIVVNHNREERHDHRCNNCNNRGALPYYPPPPGWVPPPGYPPPPGYAGWLPPQLPPKLHGAGQSKARVVAESLIGVADAYIEREKREREEAGEPDSDGEVKPSGGVAWKLKNIFLNGCLKPAANAAGRHAPKKPIKWWPTFRRQKTQKIRSNVGSTIPAAELRRKQSERQRQILSLNRGSTEAQMEADRLTRGQLRDVMGPNLPRSSSSSSSTSSDNGRGQARQLQRSDAHRRSQAGRSQQSLRQAIWSSPNRNSGRKQDHSPEGRINVQQLTAEDDGGN